MPCTLGSFHWRRKKQISSASEEPNLLFAVPLCSANRRYTPLLALKCTLNVRRSFCEGLTSAPAIKLFATASEKSLFRNPWDYKTENMSAHREKTWALLNRNKPCICVHNLRQGSGQNLASTVLLSGHQHNLQPDLFVSIVGIFQDVLFDTITFLP